MHTRLLTILAVSAFVLTLLFAVAAGAQDETTDASSPATLGGGGGIQVQQAHQQQVGTLAVEPQAQGCQGQRREFTVGPKSNDTDRDFNIEGGKFRVVYDVTFTDDSDPDNEFTLNISNGSEFFRSRSTGDNHEEFVVNEGPGDFTLDARLRPQDNGTYTVTVYDCKNVGSSNNNDGGGGGNNDGGTGDNTTDTTDTTEVVPAQTDDTTGTTTGTGTTDDTITADTVTTDPAATAEDAGDSANREGSFRCDSFLHVVRDENGALRAQYRDGRGDDELIVQRFERCLEADVLANTIPDGRLPFTGGPSLPLGGGVLLLLTAALLVGRVMRR